MNEKKTCNNCNHYHSIIIDYISHWHDHNYCDFWKTRIPAWYYQLKEDDTKGIGIAERAFGAISYDDIETGRAGCWAFEPKSDSEYVFTDEEMDKNLKAQLTKE